MASAVDAPSSFVAARQTGRVERWLEAERDQLPLWLPVALGAGIAAWFGLSGPAEWRVFALVTAGCGALAVAAGRGGRASGWAGVLMLTVAAGCLLAWARAERVRAPVLARAAVVRLAGEVTAVQPQPARERTRLEVRPRATDLPPRVRINVDDDLLPRGIAPGARIAVRARLVPPPGPALPGAYDFARVAWFTGLGATGKALERVEVVAPAPPAGWRQRLATARGQLTRHIQAQLPGSTGGVAAAFVTGDTGAIGQQESDAFRRSGLAHLLSISGLHITAAVAGAVLVTLRLLALWPWLALRANLPVVAAGAGALAGIAYTLLSGAEVPTVRSLVAALLVLLGLALGREAMTLRLVAAGALAVLLVRPEALAGPSFQLSFAAVTAIIALHEQPRVRAFLARREEAWPRRAVRALAGLVATGVLVEAALAPIAAWHFHRAGFYGALANIVAIPWSTFVVMPLEAAALLGDMVGVGAPAWWMAGRALDLLIGLARMVAGLPGAVAALPSMPAGAFACMVAGGLWLALWRTRLRRWGLVPLAFGAAWALAAPAPDLLVTGDGRHVAVRGPDGTLHLLRARAGDYVREQLGEAAGVQGAALELEALPGARCSPDLCLALIGRWRLLATRSSYPLDRGELTSACAWADIAVSDRRLPRTCRPRALKLDRPALARSGGLAVELASGRVRRARGADGHPWTQPGTLQPIGEALHGRPLRGVAATPIPAGTAPHSIGSE